MNDNKTSFIKKENKKKGNIKFEEFPGEKRNNEKNIEKTKNKNVFFYIIIVLVIIILSILSSYLNEHLLNRSKDGYKVINNFKGVFATIDEEDRKDLFIKIGFDKALTEIVKKDDYNYMTSYAYKKKYNNIDELEYIRTYYDDYNRISFIDLGLIYNKESLVSAEVVKDVNNVLNNFINLKIDEFMINDSINNKEEKTYEYVDGINIMYEVKRINESSFYLLNMQIENK